MGCLYPKLCGLWTRRARGVGEEKGGLRSSSQALGQ